MKISPEERMKRLLIVSKLEAKNYKFKEIKEIMANDFNRDVCLSTIKTYSKQIKQIIEN